SPARGGRRCTARPYSRIFKRRARISRRRLSVSGSAAERPCANSSRAVRRRERVRHVYVSVDRGIGHGRCRFLARDGHLSRARSCRRPIELRARGTRHWRLRRRIRLARGNYMVRSVAVDGFGRRQRRARTSLVRVRVR
ncbi:MAG: hypothetical protein ACRDMJ_19290, partial [Solirubrobacteraceae bacterium]